MSTIVRESIRDGITRQAIFRARLNERFLKIFLAISKMTDVIF